MHLIYYPLKLLILAFNKLVHAPKNASILQTETFSWVKFLITPRTCCVSIPKFCAQHAHVNNCYTYIELHKVFSSWSDNFCPHPPTIWLQWTLINSVAHGMLTRENRFKLLEHFECSFKWQQRESEGTDFSDLDCLNWWAILLMLSVSSMLCCRKVLSADAGAPACLD